MNKYHELLQGKTSGYFGRSANLHSADLRPANLTGDNEMIINNKHGKKIFEGDDLAKAGLFQADLTGANLTGVKMK